MKTIIVKNNNKDVFFKDVSNIKICKYYSKKDIFFKIFYKLNFPQLKFYVQDWILQLDEYDCVILFDNGFNNIIPKLIRKQNKKIKIILWFWNPISISSKKFLNNKLVDEFWTYNLEDSKKFNINYNTQFFCKDTKLKENVKLYDIVYLGTDKGRNDEILKYQKTLNSKKIISYFKIVKDKKDYLSYDKYLDLLGKSTCIFEFLDSNTAALTLRSMESIFFEKKLITNNIDIAKYDFYDKENIFVLGVDDIEQINKFINKPYKKLDKKIVTYYDINYWIKRFYSNGEKNDDK